MPLVLRGINTPLLTRIAPEELTGQWWNIPEQGTVLDEHRASGGSGGNILHRSSWAVPTDRIFSSPVTFPSVCGAIRLNIPHLPAET